MARSEEVQLCNHVKANGKCCASPALKDEPYCYFHRASRERTKRLRRAARLQLPFQLPVLEDMQTIQLAIGDVLNALLAGLIDHKTAGLLLYGLQTAAGNARRCDFDIYTFDRRFEHYQEEEEESLEREISREVAKEQKAARKSPAAAPQKVVEAPKQQPLPHKKAPAGVDPDVLEFACDLALEKADALKKQIFGDQRKS